MKKTTLILLLLIYFFNASANYLFIPMDDSQKNHLKAYGIAFWILKNDVSVDWLLNYKGGSFMVQYQSEFEKEMIIRGVSYEVISGAKSTSILNEIAQNESNMDAMRLDVPPKIAVYSPKSKQPWDDAVTLVLSYAEIPYDVIFDDEVLQGDLVKYDWLHLHHEDFTGQYDKFWSAYRFQPWFIKRQQEYEESAKKHGFEKVTKLKLAVVKKIKEFTLGGGFLFAMCTATDTYDIALAASEIDIVESQLDGDGTTNDYQNKLNFDETICFKNFNVITSPLVNEFSNIDNTDADRGSINEENDFFELFTFSAKWDPIPTMLTQNHKKVIKGFMGQTTAFKPQFIKSNIVIMAENQKANEAKYVHGTLGKGQFTFYGGHDPEDYRHFVGEEPTDLNLHPNSPGYRLILNNILFPAAKKQKRKT